MPTNEENYLFQKDNQGEIYQEQGTSYLPYIIGRIGIIIVIFLGWLLIKNKRKEK